MKRRVLLISCCLLVIIISGCASTAYDVARDERSIGTIADDEKIVNTIRANFLADYTVKVLDVSVDSYNGRVYLVGEYTTQNQKSRAVEIAEKVHGVKSVSTYLLPKTSGSCGTADNLRISTEVKAGLVADKDIASTNIDLKVVQCIVVLLGVVASQEEIKKAVAHARSVKGVRSVKSFLTSAR